MNAVRGVVLCCEEGSRRESLTARGRVRVNLGVRALPGAACAAFAALVLSVAGPAAPAVASPQRGHVFSFAFASKGEGAGKLSKPAGVAVSEASGDVYVVDAGNDRVERFGPSGEFVSAWGWGVSDGEGEYEVCSSGCKAGLAGEGEGEMDAPEAIAVDNSGVAGDASAGDVYVLADTVATDNVVEKFSPTGEFLGELSFTGQPVGELGGVAVDGSGGLWVSELGVSPELLVQFSDAAVNVELGQVALQLECSEPRGLAVDAAAGTFYVRHQLAGVGGECPESTPSPANPAVIAGVAGDGSLVRQALDFENSTGVAVDQASSSGSPLGAAAAGDVYVDNATSVAAFSADGQLVQRFGSEQLSGGAGVAVDSSNGEVFVADARAGRVDVYAPEGAGAPGVDGVSFADLSASSTRLEAQVDPHGADTHVYFQYGLADCRAAPAQCSDVPPPPGEDVGSGFAAVPVSATASGLAPGARYFYRAVAVNAEGESEDAASFGSFTTLPSASDVLADGRAWELVSPAEKHGALIYPIGGTTENGGPASGVIEASEDGAAVTYAANAPVGEQVEGNRALEATQAVSVRGAGGWATQDISTPEDVAQGLEPGASQEYRWFSADLGQALAQPFGPYQLTGTHTQEPPLVAGVESEERGLYVRDQAACLTTRAGCFSPLLTGEGVATGAQYGGELEFDGATSDLRHVVFSSNVALTAGVPSAPGLYEWSAGKPAGEALQMVSVLPGNKKAALDEPEAQLGDLTPGSASARNATSQDGSRVFWSALVEEHEAEVTRLFMRDTSSGQTIVLNAAQGVHEPTGEEAAAEEVHFRDASSDGSRVFFTDTFPLSEASMLRPGEGGEEAPADLYVCEIVTGGEGPECDLDDLTVDPSSNLGESADVVGTLLGASEDGSYVYFVANGVLDPEAQAAGATPGGCARPNDKQPAYPSATCNLYLEHRNGESGVWEAPRFIARLSQEDQPDWGGTGGFSLATLTARVSPNGRYLAFMSKEPLTGYDNVDQSPAAHGARDEEVYLYDSLDARLTCASCDPSGSQPQGVLDHEASGEGKGLLVDRPGTWKETEGEEHGGTRRAVDHWLAASIPGFTPVEEGTALYQSRYLSDEGRLFFDSPDGLVAHDHNGKEDVYEYEPQGLGSCTSEPGCLALISSGESQREAGFLDASASGNDVFFLTDTPLLTSDHDTSYDVYDARVCTETSPCITPPPPAAAGCAALETCRPASPPVSVYQGASGSALLAEAGAPASQTLPSKTSVKPKPLTRAQKLARALKQCRAHHRKSHKKRQACERAARKKYRPATKAKRSRR